MHILIYKFEFTKLIDDMVIIFYHLKILQIWKIYEDNVI